MGTRQAVIGELRAKLIECKYTLIWKENKSTSILILSIYYQVLIFSINRTTYTTSFYLLVIVEII